MQKLRFPEEPVTEGFQSARSPRQKKEFNPNTKRYSCFNTIDQHFQSVLQTKNHQKKQTQSIMNQTTKGNSQI
jgi:hypothetical protein